MIHHKGLPYDQISSNADDIDDDYEEGNDQEQESVIHEDESLESCVRLLHRTWIPDDAFIMWGNQQLLDSVEAVKLFKFFGVTTLFIIFIHEFVRWFDLEHDTEYSFSDMILYDGPQIVLDIVGFYVIGRLYKKKIAVDHLAFLLVLLISSLYVSLANKVSWYQHSFTLYEVHCEWPWQLFIFVAVVVPLSFMVIFKHIQYSVRTRVVGMKLIEIAFCVILFLVPQVSHANFHLHHWYVGWLVGMHCNFDTWWSRATMAWCWGLYVNGIAVYGRDPLQTCDYAFYISKDTRCSFLNCFMHQEVGPHNETHTVYNTPIELDWRNCSSR